MSIHNVVNTLTAMTKTHAARKSKTISFKGNKYRIEYVVMDKDWRIFKNTETTPMAVGMTSYGDVDTDSDTLAKMPDAFWSKVEVVLAHFTGDPNTEYDD